MSSLSDLYAVQVLDTTIDHLRHRHGSLPERAAVAVFDAEIALIVAETRATLAERDVLEAEQRRVEADITGLKRKEDDLTKKLRIVMVPREAEALTSELTTTRARRTALEDDELAVMERIDDLEQTVERLDRRQAELEAAAASAREALAAAEVAVQAEIEHARTDRVAAAALIAPDLLARYEHLRPRLGGVAVATLDKGRCTGCNLHLSQLALDRIRHEPVDALVECGECGRWLAR